MGIKKCPHCGSNTFFAKVIRGAKVETQEDGTFKILQESSKYDVEIVKCPGCNNDVTEADLLELVPCKNCGTLTEPKNLDAEGVCDVCQALTVRPDLVNASKEDIIRMLLHLEASTKNKVVSGQPVPMKTAEALPATGEPMPEVTISVGDTVVPEAPQSDVTSTAADKMAAARQAMEKASEQPSLEETSVEEQKTTTRKRRVKKSTTTDETEATTPEADEVEEEQLTEETTSPLVNENFINPPEPATDQAPFPEQDQVMQEMFNQQQEQVVPPLPQGGFPLFNNNEESF